MAKYAESPTVSIEVNIGAAATTVWLLISDINLPSRFSPEFRGATWTDTGPALGATFEGRNKHQAVGEWSTISTITAFEELALFEWTVGDVDNKTARWRFDLAADGVEVCTLRFGAEMGPGPSGLSVAIEAMPDREEEIVANRLREWTANMALTVDGIKAQAERP
jgi:hypothetical protein